ncbi:unnamed protein product [Oppiella nova]|uniref:Uncharacterized protein n=1 Tax=Oppiella nova TaxID=334625 RepID=A0A7R9R308_9ACAR|nr:unnamed protein product [Oppiella nova]CAG2183886.1 unnamed protein product [Oppiella nova]
MVPHIPMALSTWPYSHELPDICCTCCLASVLMPAPTAPVSRVSCST